MTAQEAKTWVPVLAPRELQYLTGIAAGKSAKEIARDNHVSPNTVRGALMRIYWKLDVHKATAAVYKARKAGLIGLMMALTVASLVADEPYMRAPRTRPTTAQVRFVRGGRSGRSRRWEV